MMLPTALRTMHTMMKLIIQTTMLMTIGKMPKQTECDVLVRKQFDDVF
ncbi:MAG: hypothetical protein HQL08_09640 [Nitrospirae bacterium]|nr:hypothetical protein [Nitrospirota bacterium]